MRALNWIGVLHPVTGHVTAKPVKPESSDCASNVVFIREPVLKPSRRMRRAAQAGRARGPKPLPGAFAREELGKATPPPPSPPDAS